MRTRKPAPGETAYRAGVARLSLRQVRALPEGAQILQAAGAENIAAIDEVSAFAWLPAAPYQALVVAIRMELGEERNRQFWRGWVEPFIKTPLIKIAFESIRDIARLGPGPLIGMVPRFRQLTIRHAGTMVLTVEDTERFALARFVGAPEEWWADGVQTEALIGTLHGAFDLSGVDGTIVVEEADYPRGRVTLRMTW